MQKKTAMAKQDPGQCAAIAQAFLAAIGAVVAGLLAPNLSATQWQAQFKDFFVAAASVNGALLIAIAVQARYGRQLKTVACVTGVSLTCGLVGSVLALSPLPKPVYGFLLAITVGGGIGGLIAAFVVGWANLQRDIGTDRSEATMKELAQELGRTKMQLAIKMDDGKTGTIHIVPK